MATTGSGDSPRGRRRRAAEPPTSGLVGRDDVVAQLRGVVDDAVSGSGRLAMVTGEAGMGKTTVLAEIARHARSRDARVAWGWGLPGDGAPAYWPWIQALRALALDSPLLTRSDSGSVAAAPASARFQLFDEISAQLVDESHAQPIVLLLDDLQWADPPSTLLLDFLSARLPTARLAIVAGLRPPVAGDDGLLSALTARATTVPLAGLSRDAVAQLLVGVLGRPRAGDVAADMRRRTGGNPFFVQQLAWLIRDGQHGIPPGVGEALSQRLRPLSPASLDVLSHGAVVGQRFSAGLLTSATREPTAAVGAALAIGVAHGVLSEDAPGDYRFVHDLFREYLYDRLPAVTRGEAHLSVGRALEAAATASPSELAWHFVHADAASTSARVHSAEAARDATRRLAYEDAARHWEHALAATAATAIDRIDTLLAVAESRRLAGRAAEPDFLDAAAHARRTHDAVGLARAALGLHAIGTRSGQSPITIRAALGGHPSTGSVRQSPVELAAVLAEADAALATPVAAVWTAEGARAATLTVDAARPTVARTADADRELLRLRVQASLARVLAWHDLDLARARRLAADAVGAARRAGDLPVLAACLLAAHNGLWGPGTAAQRRVLAEELVAIAQRTDDRDLLIEAQLLLATDQMELADSAFRPRLEEFLRLAGTSPQPRFRYAALVRRAMLAQLAGRFEDAAALVDQAHALGTACGVPDADDVWFTQMWDLRGAQDRQGEMADVVAESFPDPDSRPARGFQILDRAAAGLRDVTSGQLARMLDDDDHGPAPDSRRFVIDLVFAAEAATALDNQPFAERVYDALLPYADFMVVTGAAVGFRGAVAHHLGSLAAALGRNDRAETHLSAAVELHTRLGAAAWALRSRYELARLRLRSAPREVDETAMAEVAVEARGLGLVGLAQAADAAVAATRPPSASPAEFTREGTLWTLGFDGATVRMRDSKGLRDLATLLAVPGRPVAAADLVSAMAGDLARADLTMGADEIFDATARQQIRARLAHLDDEIADAEHRSDRNRAAAASAEKETLIGELAAAAGFRGGARRLGDQWERARKTATARIRDVIGRIERVHPSLGAHLQASVTTGTYCSYSPASPVSWHLR